MNKWRVIELALEVTFIVVFFLWTYALATSNALTIEKSIKEFCGNVAYRVNPITSEFVIQTIPPDVSTVKIP